MEEDTTPKTVWTGGELEAGKHGNSLVKLIVGREFPFPKSLYAVKRCIELVVRNRPNALISISSPARGPHITRPPS